MRFHRYNHSDSRYACLLVNPDRTPARLFVIPLSADFSVPVPSTLSHCPMSSPAFNSFQRALLPTSPFLTLHDRDYSQTPLILRTDNFVKKIAAPFSHVRPGTRRPSIRRDCHSSRELSISGSRQTRSPDTPLPLTTTASFTSLASADVLPLLLSPRRPRRARWLIAQTSPLIPRCPSLLSPRHSAPLL